uniref:DUF4378 domain-containing protein n=1 Tax=Oryza meridionalis TaxID=40149 RepID=A0A0E0F049_9ORYZ
MAGGSKPLRLKDLLELDCESCSAAGFRCYPRRLCVAGGAAEAAAAPMRHRLVADRSSSSAMRRPKLSSLSKSLSRRLRGGFWRRREEEDEEAAAAAAAPPASPTAPAVPSCCSSSSDSETSESSNSTGGRKSRSHSDYSEISSASSDDSLHAAGEPSTTGADHEVMKRGSKEEEEADDKEQLSPVGVMDFPFDEDDEDAAAVDEEERVAAGAYSFSFSDSLAQLQRRKMQLQPKIRRLGSMAELSGVDLEARFAASESDRLGGVVPVKHQCITDDVAAPPPRHDDNRNDGVSEKDSDDDEDNLLDLLADTVSIGVVDDVTERLLLDFFVETKCSSRHNELRAPTSPLQERRRRENGETMRLAKAWLEGTGTLWTLNDVLYHGEDVMVEMERSRRWMHAGEEEREAGVVVAAMVMDELLHELVSDLIALQK